MIKLTATTQNGDATYNYIVDFTPNMTVEEFINEYLKSYPKTWGEFTIRIDKTFYSGIDCEFHYGKIINEPLEKIYLDATIKEVSANGGYGSMRFWLKI